MVIQQLITTYWTKASRGGKAATIRNAVPEKLPSSILQAHFSEFTGFEFSTERDDMIGELLVSYIESENLITVFYAGIRGVPHRQIHSKKIFQLFPGEWGQVIANCRGITCEDTWTYGKHVINIYMGNSPPENIFLTSNPKHRYSDERKLY